MCILLLFLVAVLSSTGESRCECGWQNIVLRDVDDYRTMASPDYPRNYCARLDCSWLVRSPSNSSRILFSSSSFDLRDGDQLLFYSSKSQYPHRENSPVIHSCTHLDKKCEVESPSSFLSIRFVSQPGGQQSHLGFHGTLSSSGRKSIMGLLLSYSLHLLIIGLIVAFLLSLCVFILCCCRCSSSPSKESKPRDIVESRLI